MSPVQTESALGEPCVLGTPVPSTDIRTEALRILRELAAESIVPAGKRPTAE